MKKLQLPKKLPESALLTAIVDSADDAIISKDLDGIITSWNPAAERIFGYRPEEVIGRPITILIPPERMDEEPGILARIRKGERIDHYQTVRRRKDGTYIDVSITVSPIYDEDGKVIGASKIARDVVEQRRIQERLRRSEERFRLTLSSIGDAVISTDRQGRVQFMNPIAEQLTGWTQQEAFGSPLSDIFKIVNEFSRETVESPVTKVLREGHIVGMANHTVLIAKDGTERPIDDSGAPVREITGDLTGVVLVFRDVSQRRKAELTARWLASIVAGSDDAIIGKSLEGIIQSWNQGAERIFGYTAQEAIGKSIMMLIPPDRHDEEKDILHRIRQGERVDHFVTQRLTKDKRLIDISLTVSPIKDAATGKVLGASKIARNITEQKRANEELKDARARLQAHAQELERTVNERTEQLRQTVSELEAFGRAGRITEAQRRRLAARPRRRTAGGYLGSSRRVMDRVLALGCPGRPVVVRGDAHKAYDRAAAPHRRRIHLESHPNPPRGPKGSARSPEARRRDAALFPVDLLHKIVRHSMAHQRRETIAFGRRLNAVMERFFLMAVWRNFVQRRSERRRRSGTPAMALGLADEAWPWTRVLSRRLFPDRVPTPATWAQLYRRLWTTPIFPVSSRHQLIRAF